MIVRLNRLKLLEMKSKIQYLYLQCKESFAKGDAQSEAFLNQSVKGIILIFILITFFSFNPLHLSENQANAPKMSLSEYGFFKGNMAEQKPVEGIIPYALNTPLFSDYAEKLDRKSTRLNSSHRNTSRMPSSA